MPLLNITFSASIRLSGTLFVSGASRENRDILFSIIPASEKAIVVESEKRTRRITDVML